VENRVKVYIDTLIQYAVLDADLLRHSAITAAIYHDLGKLDVENQEVLSGKKSAKALPVNHVDAGTAYLLQDDNISIFSALVIYAHHIGYPNFDDELDKKNDAFRDPDIRQKTDKDLKTFERIHQERITTPALIDNSEPKGIRSVFLRMLLSCLADADHTDTAINAGQYPFTDNQILLNPYERLKKLDEYVHSLGNTDSERNKMRRQMYEKCRDAVILENISSCEGPVGSGKTTAIMAHLLSQAQKRNLRRIFVVLPFTNIIQQSVEVYRKALVLPGENPEEVVAELHHRADFETEDIRHLTALWRAPIIVTTAVAFFETLASNTTSTLRRLHELPGSAIFIDEAHAALPVKLLPLAWQWITSLADEWSCYWILASGSLSHFWEIREITDRYRVVPEIIADDLKKELNTYEQNRIIYQNDLLPKNVPSLIDLIQSKPGPRLVILNTVQSAAVVAKHFEKSYGKKNVEHISTALLPKDRTETLKRIKERLNDPDDMNWTLIATSCVEAGVDFSFRTGFRELGSLTSLLQASGRVNRNGLSPDAEVWTFCLAEDGMTVSNPGMKNSAAVLRKYLEANTRLNASLVTDAIEKEIKLYGMNSVHTKLIEAEERNNFPFVETNFQVIESDTRIAVVDDTIVQKIKSGKLNWRELQQNSLQIAKYKLQELHMKEIKERIYHWSLRYDNFIGYMAGIMQANSLKNDTLII